MDHEHGAAPSAFPVGSGRSSRVPEEDVAYREALRLTFSFDGSQVQLMLVEPVEMIVPPSLAITDDPPTAAFWYELHDSERAVLYRRTRRHPLDPRVEVRTGDPERPLAQVDSGRTTGDFTLLVPNIADARSVQLYHWSAAPGSAEGDRKWSPVELARFPLGEGVDEKTLARDEIPPTTVSDAISVYPASAVIHLRASDNTGDVVRTVYRLDDGDDVEGLTVAVEERGSHRLLFWSVDRAGNVESENLVTFTVGEPVAAA